MKDPKTKVWDPRKGLNYRGKKIFLKNGNKLKRITATPVFPGGGIQRSICPIFPEFPLGGDFWPCPGAQKFRDNLYPLRERGGGKPGFEIWWPEAGGEAKS